MKFAVISSLLLTALLLFCAPTFAAETAAEKLLATTCTVRISAPRIMLPADAKPADPKADDATSPAPQRGEEVTVASGVSLGNGLLITCGGQSPALALEAMQKNVVRYRITLSGGEQAEAKPRVIDRYSGLLLLEIEKHDLPAIALAAELPAVGSTILSAAAAGLEKPSISSGILGGVDRSLAGIDLPPLLECDVRTTETSSGAAVVDASGKLVGIVVAAATPTAQRGWTYAVPVAHVERVVKAKVADKLIELKRLRPVVGFTVGPAKQEGLVQVERVDGTGPAAKAGVVMGDVVLEADGRKIRSAYQVVGLVLRKQPGDRVNLLIDRGGQPQQVEITLGATAAPLALAAPASEAIKVGPQLTVSSSGTSIAVRGGTQEVAVGPENIARRGTGSEVEMLRVQVAAFEQVIRKLQAELAAREQSQEALRKEIETLRRELK